MAESEMPSPVPSALSFISPHTDRFEEWLHASAPLESIDTRFDVRRAVPEEFGRIYDLVNECYGLNRSRTRFDWIYRHNPYGTARCWVTFDRTSGQLVSSWASWPWPMARGGQWVEGCLEGDWVVAREWQRHGIGSLCTEAVLSHAWQTKILRLGWGNKKSRAFAAKHGRAAEVLGPVPLAVLILSARKYLGERQWPALASAVAGRTIDSALATWSKLVLRRDSKLRIEAVRRFESSVDEVTRRCMSWSGFWSPHNAEFLNWRYLETTSSEHLAFALVDGSNVEGYYVLKIGGEASWLTEFVAPASPIHVPSTLLLHVIETARAAGCSRIRFSSPPGWRHWKLLHWAGFLPVPSDVYMWPWPHHEEPERGQLSAWQWTPGDMDSPAMDSR